MQHEFDHAMHNCVVQRHDLVNVPGLDRAGIDAGEVNLAELLKVRRIAAQHVHDFPRSSGIWRRGVMMTPSIMGKSGKQKTESENLNVGN